MPKKANLVDGRYEIPSALFSFVHPVDDKKCDFDDHRSSISVPCWGDQSSFSVLFSSLLAPPLSRKYYSVQ